MDPQPWRTCRIRRHGRSPWRQVLAQTAAPPTTAILAAALLATGLLTARSTAAVEPVPGTDTERAPAAALGQFDPIADGTRHSLDLDHWRFHLGGASGGTAEAAPDFDDSSWTEVAVPHTWNATDGQDGGNDYHRGAGWYRTAFTLPESSGALSETSQAKLFLEFDGANLITDAWLNGEPIGSHAGGYGRFRFEGTGRAHWGEPNLLAVRVSNAPHPDVPPLEADYTFFGGLYRPVRAILTQPVHLRMLDYGGPGVAVSYEFLDDDVSLVVRPKIWNSRGEAVTVTAHATLFDVSQPGSSAWDASQPHASQPGGWQPVGRSAADVTIPAGQGREVNLEIHVPQPRRWHLDDPFLYHLRVAIDEADHHLDVAELPLGFRTVAVDPDRGFLLNEQPVQLRGVARHQDRLNEGWAVAPEAHLEDLELIREMGANAIRLAHYPQDPLVYEYADRHGLLVWTEIPLISRATGSQAFENSAVHQLMEMTRQHGHHPSIGLWGLGNEITQRTDPDVAVSLLRVLAETAAAEDASRPTVVAHCCTEDVGATTSVADAVGFNRYFGWYGGTALDLGPWADALHHAAPDMAIGVGEYGAGASIHHHREWDSISIGDPESVPRHDGAFHPEEYQAAFHEASWRQIAERPFVWGAFIWNMFDFASDARSEGDTAGRNDKGLVTYDRRVRKDAYWFYKAAWSDEPVVHIASRRFDPRTRDHIDIKVYSNAVTVTLEVNGATVDASSADAPVYQWSDQPLDLGENVVRATGHWPDQKVIDEVVWTRIRPLRVWLPVVLR